jgi:hypothetical protein
MVECNCFWEEPTHRLLVYLHYKFREKILGFSSPRKKVLEYFPKSKSTLSMDIHRKTSIFIILFDPVIPS